MAPEHVDTRTQRVALRTRRGTLHVGPHGRIDGLWRVCERELLTNAQVRELLGLCDRHALLRLRERDDFPKPVLKFPAQNRPLELWSRTMLEEWARAHRP